MQIILLTYLMIFMASASQELCDELELSCYQSLCSESKYVPNSPEELEQELAARSEIKLSKGLSDKIETLRSQTAFLSKIEVNQEVERIWEQILTEYSSSKMLAELFSGEIKMVSGVFVKNDFAAMSIDPEFIHFFNDWYVTSMLVEAVTEKLNLPGVTIDGLIQVFGSATERRGTLETIFIADLKSKTPAKIEDQILYKQKLNELFRPQLEKNKAVIKKHLTQKIQSLVNTDWSQRLNTLKDQCNILEYTAQKTAKLNDKSEGLKLASECIKSFKAKLLPTFPKKIQKVLAKKITLDLFDFSKLQNDSNAQLNVEFSAIPGSVGALINAQKISRAFCSTQLAGDNFNGLEEKIYISPLTVSSKQKDTICHELGHFVSHEFEVVKHSKFIELKQCLANFHPNAPLAWLGKKNYQPLYFEEDFADWVSANIGEGIPHNFCQYTALSRLKGKIDKSLYRDNLDKDNVDGHSSSLFRLLHFAKIRKISLPASCQQVEEREAIRPVACYFK